MRQRRTPARALPRHPYRDSALVYGAMAAIGFVVAVATGRGVVVAFVVMAAFFVAATAWSWWRFRERLTRGEGER